MMADMGNIWEGKHSSCTPGRPTNIKISIYDFVSLDCFVDSHHHAEIV